MSNPTLTEADQLVADVIQAHLDAGLRPDESAVRLVAMAFSLLASMAGPDEARAFLEARVIPHVHTLQVEARAGRRADPPSPHAPALFMQSTPRGRQ